mgnify:CR=1 FL=1
MDDDDDDDVRTYVRTQDDDDDDDGRTYRRKRRVRALYRVCALCVCTIFYEKNDGKIMYTTTDVVPLDSKLKSKKNQHRSRTL